MLIGDQGEWKKKYEEGDKNGKKITFEEYAERSANIERDKAKAVEAAIEQMNKNIGRLPKDVVSGLVDSEIRSYKSTIKSMLKLINNDIGGSGSVSGEGTESISSGSGGPISGEGTEAIK